MTPTLPFIPTPAQRRLASHVIAHPSYQTVVEICLAADIDPSSYYKWCHDPDFRQWFLRECTGAMVFEGWHLLNLARANVSRSSTAFRALFSLIFDVNGQAALESWQQYSAAAAQGPVLDVACLPEPNQQLSQENASFLSHREQRAKPSRIAHHLESAIAGAADAQPA